MATAHSLKEWIKIYEDKTGDTFGIPEGYRFFYMAERGFASMKPDFKTRLMVVYQVCGDGKFWRDFAEMTFAVPLGLDAVCTICTRPIKPYIRGFGWEILDEQCKDGQYRFLCQDSSGRPVMITHKDVQENGLPEYWVTHYCHKRRAAATIEEFLKEKEVLEDCMN